jgi:hypothetical protein
VVVRAVVWDVARRVVKVVDEPLYFAFYIESLALVGGPFDAGLGPRSKRTCRPPLRSFEAQTRWSARNHGQDTLRDTPASCPSSVI